MTVHIELAGFITQQFILCLVSVMVSYVSVWTERLLGARYRATTRGAQAHQL